MPHERERDRDTARGRDDEVDESGEPTPDVLPTDAPRGAPTIPGTSDTGTTTPPISGWGETLEGEEVLPETSSDPRPR